jgi:hypothetical protein
MTRDKIVGILNEVECRVFDEPVRFHLLEKGDGFLLQAYAFIRDNKSGVVNLQKGGKFYISSHAIKDEVVNKAFHAFKCFVEHEVREGFTYRGQMIYGPHMRVDTLVEFARQTEEATRPTIYETIEES